MLQPDENQDEYEDEDEIERQVEQYKRSRKPLAELSILINECQDQCQAKERIIGEYLLSAKEQQLEYEQWSVWLKENCPGISECTAQKYMFAVPVWRAIAEKLGHYINGEIRL